MVGLRYRSAMTTLLPPYFPLTKGRAHETCGAGAPMFAFALAAQVGGPIMWVHEDWGQDQLNPAGFCDFLDPSNLLVSVAQDQTNLLAVTEEALRSGAVPLVITQITKPLSLTAGRRLQLAAREGKSTALSLISPDMGSNAAETRWQCAPVFDPASGSTDSTLHRWDLIKNKSGTLGAWYVKWDTASRRLFMVSPAGQRTGAAGAPD